MTSTTPAPGRPITSRPITGRPITNGAVPKHVQLREVLLEVSPQLAPDSPIPSERELMETYEVSRATVRRAIESLIAEGMLHRVQGKGTFVAGPRVQSHLHLASFTQDMQRRGKAPSTRLVRIERASPPEQVSAFLGLRHAEQAWRVERVRLAAGEPMAFEAGWYCENLLPDLDRHDLTRSLYALFATEYGLAIDTAEQTVWAEAATAELARQLDISPGASLLTFDRASRSAGRPLERVLSHYRGDRYQIHISLDSSMPQDA